MKHFRARVRRSLVIAIVAASHFGAVCLQASDASADVIVAWNFNGRSGNEGIVGATTGDSAIVISRGPGVAGSGLSNAFSSTDWTTGVGSTIANAPTNGDFFHLAFKVGDGGPVSLSDVTATFRRSSTGPNQFLWQYDIGSGFLDIGSIISYTDTVTTGSSLTTSLSGVTDLQNISSGTIVNLRLLGAGANGGTGTFAFGPGGTGLPANDLTINGTGTVTAVPEPTTFALGSLLAISVVGRGSWRRFRDRKNRARPLAEGAA